MSDNRSDQISEKIDEFAEKNKLSLVIPLLICVMTAIADFRSGVGLLLFFASVWIFLQIVGKVLSIVERLLPNNLSPDETKALQEAGTATLFLGGMAIIGIVLRSDNFFSNLVQEKIPEGMSLSFIDPTFAAVVLLCIWIYTGYRIKR